MVYSYYCLRKVCSSDRFSSGWNWLTTSDDFKGRIHVFCLNEFNKIIMDGGGDHARIKTKSHCKDHRIEFLNGCHVYAVSKQFSNKPSENFQIASACGKKVYISSLKYNSLLSNSASFCETCQASTSSASHSASHDVEVATLFKLVKVWHYLNYSQNYIRNLRALLVQGNQLFRGSSTDQFDRIIHI